MARFAWVALAAVMAGPVAAEDFTTVEPGFAKGTVRDMAGHPLAGAVIFMDGSYDTNVQYTTKDDGNFRMRLPPGAFKPLGWIYRKFDGQNFKLDLTPDSSDTLNDADGAVVNYVWHISGDRPPPDMSSYGGFIYVQAASGAEYFVADPQNITFTLVPTGPLIDGSTGETLTRKGGAPRSDDYGKIRDVPIGRYTISAVYAPPGKKPQTLRFRNIWASDGGDAYVETLEFGIQAKGNYCDNCASLDFEPLHEAQAQ